MARLVRYVPSFRGIKTLRSSREVDQMLEARAERVAAAAYTVYDSLGHGEIYVDVVQQGSDTRAPRSRVAVIPRSPKALRLEAEHRVLGSALDAAGPWAGVKKTPTRARRARARLVRARREIRARSRRR